MDSFEDIVAQLRKNKGKSFGFAAAEGKSKPIIVKADKKKTGESLKSKFGSGETPIAWGTVTINDDGMTQFTCVNAKPGFKPQTLKPFFSKIKEKPFVRMEADVPDDEGIEWTENPLFEEGAIGAGDDDGMEDAEGWTRNPIYEDGAMGAGDEDGMEDARPGRDRSNAITEIPEGLELAEDVAEARALEEAAGLEPGDATLNVLWQRSFGADLLKLGVPQERLDTVPGLMEPVQCKLPGLFMRTLQNQNAAAFAQKIVDAVNAKYKQALPQMKAQFPDDPSLQGVRAAEILEQFGRDVEQIIDVAWDAFVKRYDVASAMKKKRFKAVALPALGAVAAVGGIATSGGNPVALIPAIIAAVRACVSLADAFRVYGRNLETAVASLSSSGERLQQDFDVAKVAWHDAAGELGRASLNAVATGGFGKTLSSVSSDAGALEGRRADAEIGLDKLLAKLEEVISTTTKLDADIQEFDSLPPERKTDKQIRAMNKIRAKVDELGDQVTAGLDKIAAKNPKLDRMQVEIAKVQKIVDALQAAADSPVNSLAKYEQIMTLFAGAAIGVASLGTGIATWSDEGAFFVVIGGIADGLDELNTAFGD